MEYPFNRITGQTNRDDTTVYVSIYVQAEYLTIDEAALTAAVQQWLLAQVPAITSTTAERRDQTFPVTPLPPLP
ncbi:hypothetical protein HZZ00_37580 (plasmid) [Streptomyces sp. NEAU-sy36]|uniref:hypothetical protein n=1 Tax=unclassified Streptomyces TaxID=2593676 RepID=UPI0015D5C4C7|nr:MULTISPECIES: hypothetical protein [unclassified Streptomyces]QLJ06747.1 hypothetical protein HZZ00_37580 [Streptomyces sp. NEAU-sy36]